MDSDSPVKASVRELEVAKLVALGNANKMVAAELGISVRTAETHRAKLMKKFKLRCAADITRWALRQHLIEGSNDESSRAS